MPEFYKQLAVEVKILLKIKYRILMQISEAIYSLLFLVFTLI